MIWDRSISFPCWTLVLVIETGLILQLKCWLSQESILLSQMPTQKLSPSFVAASQALCPQGADHTINLWLWLEACMVWLPGHSGTPWTMNTHSKFHYRGSVNLFGVWGCSLMMSCTEGGRGGLAKSDFSWRRGGRIKKCWYYRYIIAI